MKSFKFFILTCTFLFFAVQNANSQKVTIYQTKYWEFTPEQFPCLTETVSGTVNEILFLTGKVSVHSWPVNGVLHGNITGDEYYVDYRWNQLKSPDENGEWHAAIPQRLRHNGKLVFEAHWVFHFTIDENGAYVKETIIEKINCK